MIGAISALILAGTAALAGAPASAAAPEPEHRTVVTTVVGRDDSGNHGVWASVDLTRTVEVTGGPGYVLPGLSAQAAGEKAAKTRTEHPEFTVCDLTNYLHLRWSYTATVTDDGAFVTKAGAALSPNDGKPLAAGVKGTITGSFTATFTAPAHWCTFDGEALAGRTVAGSDAPKTSVWVRSLFTAGFDGASINDDWTWTYVTCSESWWDAANPKSSDGESDTAGDITGKACPTPAATVKPTVSATVGAGGGGSSGSDQPSLPVTGPKAGAVALGGFVLLFAGVFLVGAIRRRRTRFEA